MPLKPTSKPKERLDKKIVNKSREITPVDYRPEGRNLRKAYVKFCRFAYKNKTKIVGRDLLLELEGTGPLIIMGTHHHAVEPAIIQAISKGYIHWIADPFIPNITFTKKHYMENIPILKNWYAKLDTIPIGKPKVTSSKVKKLLETGTRYLEEGRVVASFPEGHSDAKINERVPDNYGLGHSSILQMASNAEKALGRKVPIVLVSIRKNKRTGNFYAVEQLRYLPKEFDRKVQIAKYMKELEDKYKELEQLEDKNFNPMGLLKN